ncbi:hypothetical protein CVT24_003729 [Panaeolus cyanescens]|uniref:Uncharacterized protein n=1 Tax=Panaeolus cyanescens TaxID=181874 RepID=A0A409W8C5_9AGAR|nr:hypothetical protein CVT24_003729 [Panaeolus cyanescens]
MSSMTPTSDSQALPATGFKKMQQVPSREASECLEFQDKTWGIHVIMFTMPPDDSDSDARLSKRPRQIFDDIDIRITQDVRSDVPSSQYTVTSTYASSDGDGENSEDSLAETDEIAEKIIDLAGKLEEAAAILRALADKSMRKRNKRLIPLLARVHGRCIIT